MCLNNRKLPTFSFANIIKRNDSVEAEAGSFLSSDVKLAGRATRSMIFESQIHPMQAQPVSSDSGSDSSSQIKGSRIKPAGIIRSGITSIYEEHALAMLMLESESKAAPTWFDRNSLDHDVSQELINQRSRELARSHTRTTSPITVQDLRSTSRNQSEAPSSNQPELSSSSQSGVSPGLSEAKDSITRIPNLQQSTTRRNVAFVDSSTVGPPPGPPPPNCSQCNRDKHSGYCNELRRFSAEKLREMTNGYNAHNSFAYQHDLLFKGNLDGQRVYVLRRLPHEKVKVSTEVDMLRTLQHPNIVTLIGYCDEDNHLALVFGFVCNRNLSFHLDVKNFKTLQWPLRANLAVQVAQGLVFLHDNSIIHGNVNAMYLFLHRDFTPVIAQFPLARRVEDGQKVIVEDRSGDEKSRGYLAPEYEPGGSLSMQQDVYAFGVVLFELVSGRPACYRPIKTNKFLGEWCRDRVQGIQDQGSLCSMVDPRLEGTKFNKCDVLRMMKVAALCTQKDPKERPLMREVLKMLMVKIEDLQAQSSDESDRADQAIIETHAIPTGSQVQPMINGETEIEQSQAPEHPDTCDKQVRWANPVSDAMNEDIFKKVMPLSDMVGKFMREFRAACELLHHKVPLRPKTTRRRYDNYLYPSFNYYQGRITRRLHLMSAHSTTPAEKGFLRRPPTPGHRLHKSRPGDNCYSSPPFLQSSPLASLETIPLSPGHVLVFRTSGANSARSHRRRVKFESQRRWL